MGLNKTDGETLPHIGLGKPVPTAKWAEKFAMAEVACAAAAIEFAKLGAPRPVKLSEENILVQEYHLLRKVVWIFWLPIKGQDKYYVYTFDLGEKVIGELAVTGNWPIIYAMPPDARPN